MTSGCVCRGEDMERPVPTRSMVFSDYTGLRTPVVRTGRVRKMEIGLTTGDTSA